MKHLVISSAIGVLLSSALLLGCDTDISGDQFNNQPPETELSVRDMSLTDNLSEEDRLTSTVLASWVGDDPDGFVDTFEFRFFDESNEPGAEEDWIQTAKNDTLILLPIESGFKIANVVFEVRAIDNEGTKDPSPARTVFPIQNSPPEIRLSSFDLPPDTTFPIFSLAWTARDPDGPQNLDRIEISLNDSLNFVSLPVDIDFVTIQAQNLGRDVVGNSAEASVFLGRGFIPSEITIPDLRLDSDNVLFLRSVDATDTTSTVERYEWYVKSSSSNILLVNDWRKNTNLTIQSYHEDILNSYLPAGAGYDVWRITDPVLTGNTGVAPRSDALPPNAVPTLQQFLANYDFIYWISSASTNRVTANNFPLVASVMDVFFSEGGKLMMHTPMTEPLDPEANASNPALAILPLDDLVILPDSLRRLSIVNEANITPIGSLPDISVPLPPLAVQQFLIGQLPFISTSSSTIPLYEAEYEYLTLSGSSGPWPGSSLVMSISADQRIGLFALPLINESSGAPILTGTDGDPEAARDVVRFMLESLGFPKQ